MDDNAPNSMRHLRACLRCGLIKTFDQFKRYGCDNCEDILRFRDKEEMVNSCTTDDFKGFVVLVVDLCLGCVWVVFDLWLLKQDDIVDEAQKELGRQVAKNW